MAIVWNWDNFTGGEADTRREGPKASVQEAVGVNLRQTPGEVHLGGALVDTGWTIAGNITLISNLSVFGGTGILVATDLGNIYIDGVLKVTLATGSVNWDTIVGIGYMAIAGVDYLYYFSFGVSGTYKIHRSLLNGTSFLISHLSYTSKSGFSQIEYIPVLSEPTKLIFGSGNIAFHLDGAEIITPKLTLSDNEGIAEITVFQNRYRVYVNIGYEKGVQYFWDGASLQFDYKTDWEHTTIAGVTNDGGYDYAITGVNSFYSDLYRIGGSQKAIYKTNQDGGSGRHFYRYITSRKGIFYISGITGSTIGVYTMGNFYPGYQQALYLEHLGVTQDIKGHTHSLATSYFACADSKVYKVSHTDLASVYNPSGYMISLVFDGGLQNKYTKKQIDYAYVGFSTYGNHYLTSAINIEIWARADGGYFKLLKKITSGKGGVRIDRNEFITQELGDFYDLEYKVVLNGDGATTPIFRGIETYITTKINK